MNWRHSVGFLAACGSAQVVVQRSWRYFAGNDSGWTLADTIQALIVAVLITLMFIFWNKSVSA
jgi:hypothetical protein